MPAPSAPGSAGWQGTRTWYQQVALEIQQFFTNIVTSILNIGSGSILTTNYTIKEDLDGSFSGIFMYPNNGNKRALLVLNPSGTNTINQIVLYNGSARPATEYGSIETFQGGVEFSFVSADMDSFVLWTIIGNAGAKTWTYKQDGSLTLPGALILHAGDYFQSTEQTGNGMAQTVAHGLGRAPNIAIATMTNVVAAATISWTSDATNVTVTASNTLKYIVTAF